MASKKQLAQIDKQIQASVWPPDSGFVAFASKSDGLYQRRYNGPEEKLLVESKIMINQNAHGFSVGHAIKLFGSTWVKSKADSNANAGTQGLVSEIIDANNFCMVGSGLLPGNYVVGANYFLSPDIAGGLFILSNPEVWSIGNVREFIGTGTATGLAIEIDLGQEIMEAVIPTSIWELSGIDRTGWGQGKVVKFDANGNLIVGIDIQGTQSGLSLSDLAATGAIDYNPTTGTFFIRSGYIVPTTTEKGTYDTAFGWGNHANAGYLKAITKALVEAVLTGTISSHGHDMSGFSSTGHTHNYDNYGCWFLKTNEILWASISSQQIIKFSQGPGIKIYGVQWQPDATIKFELDINGLTQIVNPSTAHFIAITSGDLKSKITLAQLQTLIGGGGGGTSDHSALSNLAYAASGHTGFAKLAGDSTQAFSASTLTCASTATATNFILSDRRVKRRISKIKLLKKFDKVQFCQFELKADRGKKRYGVIAQELEAVAPEMVQENEQGIKMVNYIDLLIAKMARLEQRIKELEGKQ